MVLTRTLKPLARATLAALWLALGAATVRAEPDEAALGKRLGYPVSGAFMQELYRVGAFSGLDKVPGMLVDRVAPSAQVTPLPSAPVSPAIVYRWRNETRTLDEYLERQRTTGLLILKNGEIVTERYRYGRTETMRFLSFSMAKSVTAMLVGIAQDKGLLDLDAPSERYVKSLEGSAYGQTSLRHLLRMSSGRTVTETYNGDDDSSRLWEASVRSFNRSAITNVLRSVKERHSAPGEKFVYASAETEVLGRALTAATGKSLAELTHEWLWQPLGAEHESFWCKARDGQAGAYFCFNASLRDWARLGWMLAQDGRIGDKQIVPRDFILDGTDAARVPPSHQPFKATPWAGYGHQFWIQPLKERTFALQGVHGQSVFVQPSSGLVMVHTAVFKGASGAQDPDAFAERHALWLGVLHALGGNLARY
jgi:CubicO group peptidase (beta-lactamase class C family)